MLRIWFFNDADFLLTFTCNLPGFEAVRPCLLLKVGDLAMAAYFVIALAGTCPSYSKNRLAKLRLCRRMPFAFCPLPLPIESWNMWHMLQSRMAQCTAVSH